MTRWILLGAALLGLGLPVHAGAPPLEGANVKVAPGLAAKYPDDVGIEKDPAVLLYEGFEKPFQSADWMKPGGWFDLTVGPGKGAEIVSTGAAAGKRCLQYNLKAGKQGSGGMFQLIKPSEVLYFRYYRKFEQNWQWPDGYGPHDAMLFGGAWTAPTDTDLSIYLDFWMTGDTVVRIASAKQKLGYDGWHKYLRDRYPRSPEQDPPGGNALPWNRSVPDKIVRGKWHCVEAMVKLSTPGKEDGEIRLWVNGKLVTEYTDLPLRDAKHPDLKLNMVFLAPYFHPGSPKDQTHWADAIAVAASYIGPVVAKSITEEQVRMPTDESLAAQYPNDAGLARDPDVVFADDFESWPAADQPPADKWDDWSRGGTQDLGLVPGAIGEGLGKHVLELAVWQEGAHDVASGLARYLGNYRSANDQRGPGYEELYVRYYQKFDADYTPGVANHGSLLGGRDIMQPDARWVGQADTRDVAANGYFTACLQPYGGDGEQPFHWGFYSYHCDKPGRWGDYFPPVKMATIEVGKWYCLEWHVKLNSVDPLAFDGVEELWVDGELSIRKTGLRYRKVPQLTLTCFRLTTYNHPGLPTKYTSARPLKIYYDNLVIATRRIGGVHPAE